MTSFSRFSVCAFSLAIGAIILVSCSEPESQPLGAGEQAISQTEPTDDLAWNHPQACFECHSEAHRDWKGSHHARANRRIDMDFEDTPFATDEVTDEAGNVYEFKAEDGTFIIEDRSLEGHALESVAKSPVDSVIGTTPIWQYLVPFPGGRLQTQSLTWDALEEEWYSVYGADERTPGDWGHWTGQGMNWNSNCAFCHMTDYKKNYDFHTDSYASTWQIEAISCIQCHQGMEAHVESARRGDYESKDLSVDKSITMENCASCHSRREELTKNDFHAGESFDEHFRMVLPDVPGLYFENGQALEEDYVWTSFRLSKMGHAGVTCFDCHDPHTAETKVPATDNSLCMQCHSTGLNEATIIDESAHSHHPVGTTGAQCVQCHMPERVYMGRDPRRDHGFTIPSPLSTIERGEPNACTQCHNDQSAEWALEHFENWYGDSERVKELHDRAAVLHRGHMNEADAWQDLIRLVNSEENPYWRSTYVRMLANYPEQDDALKVALQAKQSKNPVERDAAMMLLTRRPDRLADVESGLRDPSRMVRIRSAEALRSMYNGNQLAFREWREYLEMNSDRPAGALQLAELNLSQGNVDLARQLVLQAVGFDRNNSLLKYDAAIILSRAGDLKGALALLEEGREQDATVAVLAYGQGLLRAESGDLSGAIKSLEDAVKLDTTQPRWWYNLAVSYYQFGQFEKAVTAAERALELEPGVQAYLEIIQLAKARVDE
ncbi:ammonia-forming cytochrome c nitrite reductase subunit c552 [Puniceicoccaceae bacterium K14]|nr:ammonia-forming cytochrome c nitrite reductase subunit c552 [Puniceicoccaceae bacterium K14]